MIKKTNVLFILAIITFTLVWTSCKTGKSSGPSYVGKWKYEVPDMPDNNTGVLVISKEGDNYSCVAVTDYGDQKIDSFDIQDGQIKASFTDAGGTLVEFDGSSDGKNLSDTVVIQVISMSYTTMKVA